MVLVKGFMSIKEAWKFVGQKVTYCFYADKNSIAQKSLHLLNVFSDWIVCRNKIKKSHDVY